MKICKCGIAASDCEYHRPVGGKWRPHFHALLEMVPDLADIYLLGSPATIYVEWYRRPTRETQKYVEGQLPACYYVNNSIRGEDW